MSCFCTRKKTPHTVLKHTAQHPALTGGVFFVVVPLAGFKPAPAEVEAQCSVQLSYRGV